MDNLNITKEIQSYYTDIPEAPMPTPQESSRFGQDFLREINELQVGYGSNVMRVDQSGLWLGASKFIDAPFSVDMLGNIIAKSFKTGDAGQHIEIDSANTNQIKFFDNTTLFGLLEVDYNAGTDIGYINLLAQDNDSGISIDVGIGASAYSSVSMFSSGGGFYTNGNASSGFNDIFGHTGGYFGIHTDATVDYIMTDLLPVGDPVISGALYVDINGFVKQSA